MSEHFAATEPGHCDCCMTAYEAGAALHVEFERYRVLDVHPLPKIAAPKRKWRLQS